MSELSDATARLTAATVLASTTVTNLAAKVGELEAAAGQPVADPDVPAALAAMNEASATIESLAKQDPQAVA